MSRPPPSAPLRSLRDMALATSFAVASVVLYVTVLRPWALARGFAPRWSEAQVTLAKVALGLAFALLLAAGPRLRRWRPLPRRGVILGAFAAMGFVAYLDFGDTGDASYLNVAEVFHYALGAKYARELRYDGLYACAALAAPEAAPAGAVARDLASGDLRPRTAIVAEASCRQRFDETRWRSFVADVAWLRGEAGPEIYAELQGDHGYNAPPLWSLVWGSVLEHVPFARGPLRLLALVDVAFLGVAFVVAWQCFGPTAATAVAVYFGVQAVADERFVVGGIGRLDWLLLLVAATALLRRRRYVAAGAALAVAAALRGLPVLFVAPVLVCLGAHAFRARGPLVRFVAGFGALSLVAFTATTLAYGPSIHRELAARLSTHAATPLTNHVGAPALLAATEEGRLVHDPMAPADDPYATWKAHRREGLAARRPLVVTLMVLVGLGVAFAAGRTAYAHRALALGLPLVVLLPLTNYYYACFVLAPLVARGRRERIVAVGVATLSSFALLVPRFSSWVDDRYLAQGAIFAAFAAAVLFALMPRNEYRDACRLDAE